MSEREIIGRSKACGAGRRMACGAGSSVVRGMGHGVLGVLACCLWGGILMSGCLLSGCTALMEKKQQAGAAVEVNGHYLYQSTLDSLTLGLSSEDSLRVAQQFISQWAKDMLMYDKGMENGIYSSEMDIYLTYNITLTNNSTDSKVKIPPLSLSNFLTNDSLSVSFVGIGVQKLIGNEAEIPF